MRFLKNKVIKTVINDKITNNKFAHKLILSQTDKITQYDTNEMHAVAKKLNETVFVDFEINKIKLNASLLQQYAEKSFQLMNQSADFIDSLNRVSQVKNLLNADDLSVADQELLLKNLQFLANQKQNSTEKHKKYLEKNDEAYPARNNIGPLFFSKEKPGTLDDQTKSTTTTFSTVGYTHSDGEPGEAIDSDFLANKELIFNGYVINSDQIQNLAAKNQIEIAKDEQFVEELKLKKE